MFRFIFSEEREKFLSLLARRRTDLQRYAENPAAKQGYIDKENDLIKKELDFILYIDEVIKELDETIKNTAEESFQRGIKVGRRNPVSGHKERFYATNEEKEAIRHNSIENAFKTWPELY
jgi:hypothetical protein